MSHNEDFERGVILKIDTTIYLLYRDSMTWQRYWPGIGVPSVPMPSSLRLAFVLGFADDADVSDFTPIQVWRVRTDGSESPQLLIEGNRPGRPA